MKHLPSAAAVAKLRAPGRYAVGHGCYLQISEWKTRAWIFRYTYNGRAKHLGLGSCDYVSLAKAREKAIECRRLLADGIDPLEQKRSARLEQRLAATRSRTFKQCALDYVAEHEGSWRGDRSRQQWLQSLQEYAFPVMAEVPVRAVGVAEVLAALERAREAPETQRRLRNRVANILDWAISRDLRPNDNPAKRPGLLPKRKRQVAHLAAMPYRDVPAFLAKLRQRPEIAARALEFQILTAGRPGEVSGARWNEIEGDTWTIPGERMKSGKPHRVPLSDAVVRLLGKLPRTNEHVFANRNGSKLHSMTMMRLLRVMGRPETAHGFRSSFRDWAAEQTSYPNHVVEQALAHAIGSGVEAAYRRGDLFEKRQRLMADWAKHCSRPSGAGDVVPIRKVEAPA
jgi:integrase